MKILFLFLFSLQAYGSLGITQVRGTINPGSAAHIQDSIRRCEQQNLEGLIIELDTPGGLLSSTRDIIQSIGGAKIPVIVYVTPSGASATSAGAIISVASHVAAMAPGTNIGAAHPVEGTGQDVKGDMGEKVTNDTAALVRAQATLRGRNVSLAEELVRKSSSLSAQEAQKAKLVEIIAQDLPDLLQQLNGRTVIVEGNLQKVLNTRDLDLKDLVTLPMSLGHTFLHHLANPNISTMLMAIGGAAIYVEVSSGFALVAPGIFGLLCLLLAFISLQLLPINIGGVLLFLVGAVLLIAEAFFTSFGLLAASGIASLILGALFLIDPSSGADLKVSFLTLGPLIGAIAVVVFFTAYLLARDRKKVSKNFDPINGHHGKVETVNSDGRSGKLFIKGEIWDFESPEPVTKGLKVKVAGKHNLVLHIEKA